MNTRSTRNQSTRTLFAVAAVLVAALTTSGLGAGQQTPPGLGYTAHPPLPSSVSLYWFVPDFSARPVAGTPDPAAAAKLARGAQLIASKDFAAALPLLSPTSLAGTPLENYASYFIGVAQIGLGRYDQALLVLSLLAAKPLDGALKELVPLRMGEAALALNAPDRAEGALVGLTQEKLADPGAVWLTRARVEDAANHRAHALEAYRTLYYDHPLSDEAADAPAALARLQSAGEVSVETDRALARAERLFAARRWADARAAFQALQAGISADTRETVALRIAECDYYTSNRRAAREALPALFSGPRGAEARYFHLLATKALGDKASFVTLARKLAADHPGTPWAAQALNELGTHYVTLDQDDAADEVFRQLVLGHPKSTHAERASWKVGWRAYRNKEFAETVKVFEAAAANFPRGDNRPAWLYWSGRARERMADTTMANARYRLVVVDYANSYYGRLAATILKEKKEGPVVARIGAAPGASLTAVEPTGDLIRALVGARMFAEALRELEYAQQVHGDSPRLQATHAWIRHQQGFTLSADERFAALRGAITTMRRAYPQFMAAGGEALPPDVLRVIFPLDYWPLITKYSDQHKLDRYLIAALMAQESTFTAEIRSYANAYGLMQIIPSTGRIYARKLGIKPFTTAMLRQPEINVRLGTQYFKDLVDRFGGAHYALASYNAGEGRIARWRQDKPGIPQDEFIDDIPFPQTQGYVKRILGTAEDYRYIYGSGLVDPDAPRTLVLNRP
jgi:soluble lytic murein transglycosylase